MKTKIPQLIRCSLPSGVMLWFGMAATLPLIAAPSGMFNVPQDGESSVAGASLTLSVSTFDDENEGVTWVEFFANNVSIGDGQATWEGRWEFPDGIDDGEGSSISIMDGGAIADYNPPDPAPMFGIGGVFTTPDHYVGEFMYWGNGDTETGAVAMDFSLAADDTLSVSILGDPPLGTRSLSGGVGSNRGYALSWAPTDPGSITIHARVHYGAGLFVDIDPVIITITGGTSPYQSWRGQHFTEAELADPAISGDAADPDGDGIPNHFEYAWFLSPKVADKSGPPAVDSTSGHADFVYRQNKAATELVFAAQACGDLADASWSVSGLTEVGRVDHDDYWLVTIRDSAPLGSLPGRFFRLAVTRP